MPTGLADELDFDSYAYKYNQANQRTNVVRTLGDYVDYTYDNAGEVASVMALSANGVTNRAQEMANYTYDVKGSVNEIVIYFTFTLP